MCSKLGAAAHLSMMRLNFRKTKTRSTPVILFLTLLVPFLGRAQASESVQGGDHPLPPGRTWFIRSDGGDRSQCTGLVDEPYPGSGIQQACGFKHPYYLFTNDAYGNRDWVVRGGDTILIRGGPYRMGYKGPAAKDFWGSCPGDPYGCSMPPLPSGTAEQPTKLLGENYAACQKKTQLFGGYGLGSILNLSGTRHAIVQCLELTDHGQCSRGGAEPNSADRCKTDYPLSDYASTGIITDANTANILLKDLDLHGLVSRGILGPVGGTITADHLRIAFNGQSGWDFDDGRGTRSSPAALIRAAYLIVEWNGCNEEYPIRHAQPARICFDQDNGGYGDGVGTPDTPLNFTCEHCLFRYNTQDGLDLLHVSGSLLSVMDSTAYGNMGQQWKMGAMEKVLFRNNVTLNNCARMQKPIQGAPANFNRGLSLFCRAGGEGFAMAIRDGGHYTLQNNTLAGYGATSYEIHCSGSCISAQITFQNNLTVGFRDPERRLWPAIFYSSGPAVPFRKRDHNVYFHMRSCPWGWTEHCVDPGLASGALPEDPDNLDTLDLHPGADSPARKSGAVIPELDHDHDGVVRPPGARPEIGAFQYR